MPADVATRIVSLVPSVTETLRAWGRDPIACTRFCEQPDLPHVGGTKDPDLARIAALDPDLIVVDEEENRREDHDELVRRGHRVHVLHVRSLGDVAPQLTVLAATVGAPWAPPPIGEPAVERLRAVVPIWRRPWMALSQPTYGASLLAHLGVAVVPLGLGPYPELALEGLAALHPDVVLAPSEPYPFGPRQRSELGSIGPTVFVDGRDLFWWGVRTPSALRRLGDQLASR